MFYYPGKDIDQFVDNVMEQENYQRMLEQFANENSEHEGGQSIQNQHEIENHGEHENEVELHADYGHYYLVKATKMRFEIIKMKRFPNFQIQTFLNKWLVQKMNILMNLRYLQMMSILAVIMINYNQSIYIFICKICKIIPNFIVVKILSGVIS